MVVFLENVEGGQKARKGGAPGSDIHSHDGGSVIRAGQNPGPEVWTVRANKTRIRAEQRGGKMREDARTGPLRTRKTFTKDVTNRDRPGPVRTPGSGLLEMMLDQDTHGHVGNRESRPPMWASEIMATFDSTPVALFPLLVAHCAYFV